MEEQQPEPDEFGMIPPKQEEQHSKENVQPEESGLQEPLHTYQQEALERMRREMRQQTPREEQIRNVYLPRLAGYMISEAMSGLVGFVSSELEKPQEPAPPVEAPDPYPSRAGWRADYAPPHDPTKPEEDNKLKLPVYIGGYQVIESNVTFDDIGGNAPAKELLEEIGQQFEEPELYESWDVPVPKGVLLKGKPGTGKTLLAKGFANSAKADFLEVPVASLLDKYYGESERKLKALFDAAGRHHRQVVVFFDEIDSLLPSRQRLNPESPKTSLVNTFLQCMDGMQSAKNVMVLGATNFPERLDAAATRPGRFDREVEVELPDGPGRRDIVARQLLGAERRAKRVLVEDTLDLDEISGLMAGFTGAEIAEVLNRTKRDMAQTQRLLRKQIALAGLDENIEFGEDYTANFMRISTQDIIDRTVVYRAERRTRRRR
jgi:AAA+ superfamily predicted ATPase